MHAKTMTDAEYRRALGEIESLMSGERSTWQGRRLELLVRQVEAWERRHCMLRGVGASGRRRFRIAPARRRARVCLE